MIGQFEIRRCLQGLNLRTQGFNESGLLGTAKQAERAY